MKCKFKQPSNEKFCRAIGGECQFIDSEYGSKCPICDAFKDLDVSSKKDSQSNE